MRKHKKWFVQVISSIFLIILAIAGFNIWIDPFWMYGHSHGINDTQHVINERTQKINHITFQPFLYDSLMIGGSRTSYINQNDFQQLRVYNFAVPGINLNEYRKMIDYAKQQKGDDFDTIILGLDINRVQGPNTADRFSQSLQKTKDPLYRWKTIISFDAFAYSIGNLMISYSDTLAIGKKLYDRENTASKVRTSDKVFLTGLQKTHESFTQRQKEFTYNENYKSSLEQLKADHPNTRFLIFTSPIPKPLFDVVIEQKRLPEYERWLKETIEVFGEVHHYYYDHSVARDYSHFIDPTHFSPQIGTMIAHQLMGIEDSSIPDDFGMVLTLDNLDDFMSSFEKES